MTRLLDRLAGRYTPAADGYPLVVPPPFFNTFTMPDRERIIPSFASHASAYADNAVVFGVTLARLQLFTEATFTFQNLADKRLFGDPSLAKLEQPWPNGTTGELLARMEQDTTLAGNSYTRDAGDRLERLRPDCVVIVSGLREDGRGRQVRDLLGYYYDPTPFDPARDPEFYAADEVAHWSPIPDPVATFRGMSWLTPVCREVNADTGLSAYKNAYLDNAATPNLLITYEKELSAEAAKKAGAAVQARHGGVANAYKTMVLDNGADVTVIGSNFEQMDFSAVQSAGENRIAVAAGVPGIVAGLKEGLEAATYSNYEQAMRRFADITMRPNWRSACAALQQIVPPPHSGARLWFDTSDIAALRQGEQERAATFQTKASTAQTLIQAGYVPDSVAAAVAAGDLSLLEHTGRIPTVLYNTNAQPAAAFPKAEPEPEEAA